MGKGGRDTKRVRLSQQVRQHCKRVSAGSEGGLMVRDNCLITHRFDSLHPSKVANRTTAGHCLKMFF